MIGYNNQMIKPLPYIMHLYCYTTKRALHKTCWSRPRMALYGPPMYCGAGHFWPACYF